MQTRQLQESWLIWLDTSDRLLRSLHEQTVAITLRDTERYRRLKPESDQMMVQLKEIDADVVTIAREVANQLGTAPSVHDMASVLDKEESMSLRGLANRVTVASRTIQAVASKNEELVAQRFAVVEFEEAGILARAA